MLSAAKKLLLLTGSALSGNASPPPTLAGTLLEFWAGNYPAWTLNGDKIASGTLGGSLGVTFAQSTDSKRPVLVTGVSGINNKPAARFTAASLQNLVLSAHSLPAAVQVFAVIQTDGTLPNTGRLYAQGTGGGDTAGNNCSLQIITPCSARGIFQAAAIILTGEAAFGSDPVWVLARCDPGVAPSVQVSGGVPELGPTSAGVGVATTSNSGALGSRLNEGEPFDGLISYLGVFTSAADLAPLQGWA